MDRLTALRIYAKVAETENFSKAARTLGLSKSAVSKHVSALEDHLGARLLYRTTRQVSLTAEGQAYLERTRRILEDLDEADRAVSSLKAEPKGTLRVNCALSFGVLHVAPALPDFLARHPDLVIDMEFTDRFIDPVEEGYDLAIRIGELDDSALVARRLATARIVLCAAPAYLERAGRPEAPQALAEHACLLYRGRKGPYDWVLGDGERVRVSGPLILNNGEALKAAALAGLGIARLPSFVAAGDLEAGRLEEVLPGHRPPSIPIHAVYPPNRHLSAKVRLFIDYLAERLG